MTDGKENFKKTSTWIRFAYMVLFGAILIPLGRFVLAFIVVGQFLMVLVKGRDNVNLRKLGNALGQWIYQGILFLTFDTFRGPRGVLARTSRIRGVIESIPRGIEE